MTPLVSIIVPAYNYGHFLDACLSSMVSQSYRSLEILVINDGSTDSTLEVVKTFEKDSRVRCFTQNNQGCIPAMNKGIELARGAYVTFCGADDAYNADHLRVLAEAMERHPDAGMVFDNADLFIDGETRHQSQLIVRPGYAERLHDRRVPVRDLFFKNLVLNTCMFVRREVLERVGGFKADIPKTGDFHLVYRIAASYPVYFINYIGTRVRCHPASMMHREPYYEANVKCLEDIRDHYPAVRAAVGQRAFAKRMGRKYFRLARYYERSGQLDKAKTIYKKAFFTRPGRPWYYWRYLRLRD